MPEQLEDFLSILFSIPLKIYVSVGEINKSSSVFNDSCAAKIVCNCPSVTLSIVSTFDFGIFKSINFDLNLKLLSCSFKIIKINSL